MGKNTSVVLGDVHNRFIQAQIAKGRFATVDLAPNFYPALSSL
jgi:Arc/MetJ-type ribon-helix-helix transcriptional regulator